VNGNSLKLHLCIFERSQGKHNDLNSYKSFGMYFINFVKFTCSKLDINQKCFLHIQNIETSRINIPFFSNLLFFYQMCTIPFEN
jgi:hypothetical protein